MKLALCCVEPNMIGDREILETQEIDMDNWILSQTTLIRAY